MNTQTIIRLVFFCVIVPLGMLVFNGLFTWLYPSMLANGLLASLIASGIVGLLLYISAKIIQVLATEQP